MSRHDLVSAQTSSVC